MSDPYDCLAMETEIVRLRVIEHAARSLIDRQDFWSRMEIIALPGEYDNLVDALKGRP